MKSAKNAKDTKKFLKIPFRVFRAFCVKISLFLWLLFMPILVPLVFFLIFGFAAFGMEEPVIDSGNVTNAIDKGIQYLKNKQKQNGQWDYEISGHTLGATAMCVIAFVEAGVSRDDSSLVRGVQALRLYRAGDNIHDTYPIAIQTIALTRFGDVSDKSIIAHNIQWLIRHQVNDGSNGDGGWQYRSGHYSTFETYYVGLAFYEAERSDAAVIPRAVWDKVRRFWERTQNADGSWGYRPLARGSGNAYSCTTNAGIISLILSTGFNDSGRFRVEDNRINCGRWDPYNISSRIDLALLSLDNPLISQQVPTTGIWNKKNSSDLKIREMRWVHYNLFAVENVGRFLGRSDIGQCDWYREGTLSLLRQLREHRDYWADASGETILETSCAVSFLAKGRRPITVAKVSGGHDYSWNLHPYNVDHLLRFVEGRWQFPLGWRHVDLGKISADELIQSPVLYFSGDKMPFAGSENEMKRVAVKLREYLDRGGFIVAEALSDDGVFEAKFRELMRLVFKDSEGGLNLNLLEASHPIWSGGLFIEPEQRRPIKGITAACRTNVIFIPAVKKQPSLSCLWEISRADGRNELYTSVVSRQVEVGLGIGLNILSYAIDADRNYRDQTADSILTKTKSQHAGQRGSIFLGVLSHGETNSTPRALPNLLRWVEANLGLSANGEVKTVGFDSGMFSYPVLFMFGRKAFSFTAKQKEMLRRYLEQGGFLFVNSICSSKQFTDSFEEQINQIFPNSKLQPIAEDDILFSDKLGGFEINSVEIRQREQSPNRETVTNLRNEKPQLYGLYSEGGRRWSVIFSPTDVLCPLESPTFSGCRTHTPNSALQLTTNFLLYTLSTP